MTNRKIALITGASRGLGRGIALRLAATGVTVLGTYRTGKNEAAQVTAEAARDGHDIRFLPFDVSSGPESFDEFVESVRQMLTEVDAHGIDHLVNNAGIGTYASYEETTRDQFDELVRVNLTAPYFLTQSLLPVLNEGARILNISTALTRGVVPGMSAYAATKGAIEVLTRYQAVELAQRSIRVNTVMGGAVETDFGGGMMHTPQVQAMAAGTIAQGRIATVDDITAAIPAILSDAFQWASGGIIDLSGGQSL